MSSSSVPTSSEPAPAQAPPKTLVVSGLPVHIYGLDALSPASSSNNGLAVLFLLHGRLSSAAHHSISRFANVLLSHSAGQGNEKAKDLLVVAFDQRNHGQREVERERNLGWAEGGKKRMREREEKGMKEGEKDNVTHAADMLSLQTGTARDVSLLIDFLPPLLFPHDERVISDWFCAGVSLGGHATWIALAEEPRLTLGIPIIASPSTLTLLSHRATHLPSPIGPIPLSAPYFSASLISLLKRIDPAEKDMAVWEGRKLLVFSGKEDELVNFGHGGTEEFVRRLREEGGCEKLEVWVQEGVGHACTPEMMERAASFVFQYGLLPSSPSVEQQAKM